MDNKGKIGIIVLIVLVVLAIVLTMPKARKFIRNFFPSPQPSGQPLPVPKSELECPAYSYTTDQIKLEETTQMKGFKVEFYRNYAYTCSKSGYHTFIIAYPQTTPTNKSQPLWIRMHGGGAGAYGEKMENIFQTVIAQVPTLLVISMKSL